ncbi:helix-turn-helix domain-containing protein [Thiotrichales bacterium 19S3-7]|nr:helix-turn-helix domain-containing protein [Thiotrichales bacterium 19S3-7]MCF6802537.1 helix-turn-helix domain-containing protein [Thiotrichales bacterium 19S3-11]
MSVEALNWAFSQTIKKSSTKLVLLALADFANDNFVAYPSYSTLEKKCSCSRSTVYKALLELQELKLIDSVEQQSHIPSVSNNGQNCYCLVVRESNQCENNTSSEIDIELVRNLHRGGSKIDTEVVRFSHGGSSKITPKPSYNHQYINIDKRKNIKKEKTHFVKPTIDEIKTYVNEKSFHDFDIDYFYDHYESNGWMIAKSKMKCWKSTINNWYRRRKQFNQNKPLNESKTKVNAMLDPNWSMSDDEADARNEATVKAIFGDNFYEDIEKDSQQGGVA